MSASTASHSATSPKGASRTKRPLIAIETTTFCLMIRFGGAREPHRLGELRQIVLHQRHVGGLQGHVGARRAHGEADRGGGQGRGVVDAVADHACVPVLRDELAHGLDLLLGEQPRPVADAELLGDPPGGRLGVPGEHHELPHPRLAQRLQGGSGIGAHRVGEAKDRHGAFLARRG